VDILLVDDNPLMQQLMARFLDDLGYSVAVAGRADEALALARQEPPTLIVLDMHLPVLDGPDALMALRAVPGCETTPAIAISGLDAASIRPSLIAGFAAYLPKPIDLDQLEATVAQHFGGRMTRSIG
jgi:CheY-like chemotaxis protein